MNALLLSYILLLFSLSPGLVFPSTFLGLGTNTCIQNNQNYYIALIDSVTGISKNVTNLPYQSIPPNLSPSLDVIHTALDPTLGIYYVLSPVNDSSPPQLTMFRPLKNDFSFVTLATFLESFSLCFWSSDFLIGVGWLLDDAPDRLSAFSISISNSDYSVFEITQIPGSYLMMPACAVQPTSTKVYFYSRTIGKDNSSLSIWEVDLIFKVFSQSWALNNTSWSRPYLFHYDYVKDKILALVEDASYNTWLVQFDPSQTPDPFTKIAQLPDSLESNPVSFDPSTLSFVYISSSGYIVSVDSNGNTVRKAITGVPPETIKKLNFLNE